MAAFIAFFEKAKCYFSKMIFFGSNLNWYFVQFPFFYMFTMLNWIS